jgi:maltooligosyltrehalose trehalohydrolase
MPEMTNRLDDPCSRALFERCKLDHSERERHAEMYSLHRDLLRLRREDPVLRSWRPGRYDGAVLGSHAFVLRAFGEEEDRLIVMNIGLDLHLNPAPEPLLAPPDQCEWSILFSTENPDYGGCGTPPVDTEENWRIPGHAAVVLKPVPRQKTTSKEEKE